MIEDKTKEEKKKSKELRIPTMVNMSLFLFEKNSTSYSTPKYLQKVIKFKFFKQNKRFLKRKI